MYKVKSLVVSGRGNKIYRSGAIVTDKNFPNNNAKLLLEQGHLEFEDPEAQKEWEANRNKKPAKVKPVQEGRDVNDPSLEDNTKGKSKTNVSDDEDPEAKKAFDDISKEEIMEYLVKKEVNFNPELGKNKLYKLYEKN